MRSLLQLPAAAFAALLLIAPAIAQTGSHSSSTTIISKAPFETAADHQSITLEWQTSDAAYSVVRYGLTPDFELGLKSVQESVNEHEVTIDGLDAATIYKLKVGAVVAADTVWSDKQIVSSGSPPEATQQINVYFSGSVDETVANGASANEDFDMAEHYISRINNAQYSIDISLHNLSQNTGTAITDALTNAAQRGVQIRMVTEDKEGDPAQDNFDLLEQEPNINLITRNVGGLMHNKFAIFDFHGGDPEDIWLITSSWNSTDTGTYNEFQNMIEFQDPAIAGGYLAEFNQMYGSSGFEPNPENARFAGSKEVVNPTRFWVDGAQIDLFFSPQANTEQQILDVLSTAQTDITLNLNLVTRTTYSDLLYTMHNQGVHVKGAIGAPWFNNTLFQQLRTFSDVYDHNKSDADRFLHSKVALVDGSANGNGNSRVITGSMNWSASGNNSNDENTIILKDDGITNLFYQEAMARFTEAEAAHDPSDDNGDSVPFLPGQGGIQLWSLNFEEDEKEFSSGESVSFIQQPQEYGGQTRVRIGGGNKISVSETDNYAGSFSGFTLEAAPTAALNFFEIGQFDASPLLYTKTNVHIRADGSSNFIYFWLGDSDVYGNDSQQLSNSFVTIRWEVTPSGLTTLYRNSESTSWNSGNLNGVFQLDETYIVEVYANNSEEAESYYRNGEEFTLEIGEWTIWVDGTNIQTRSGIQNNLSPGDYLGLIRFYGGRANGEDARLNLDNIFYSNRLPDYKTIEGGTGWQMLSAPVSDVSIQQLVRQNLTQGFSGSYDEAATQNIFTGYSDEDFVPVTDESDELVSGHGYIWYLWDNENTTASQKQPFGLLNAGSRYNENITVDLNEGGWTLLGNPYSYDLDISDIADWVPEGQSIKPTVHFWNPSAGTYGTYELSTSNGNKLSAWQGFFIESETADQLTFDAGAKTSGSSNKRLQDSRDRAITLNLSGTDQNSGSKLEDRSAVLYFHKDATSADNPWHTKKLYPLSEKYAIIGFTEYLNSENKFYSQRAFAYDPEEVLTIPVSIQHSGQINGDFSISIEGLRNIPDEWEILLIDHDSESVYDLRKDSHDINISSENNKISETSTEFNFQPGKQQFGSVKNQALEIQIRPEKQEDSGSTLPETLALHQNYPNPFNPETKILYSLPENSEVVLEVFDILGRRVQVLVNQHQQAGNYSVNWNASELSSGTYIYRLITNGRQITRSMTLIK